MVLAAARTVAGAGIVAKSLNDVTASMQDRPCIIDCRIIVGKHRRSTDIDKQSQENTVMSREDEMRE